MLGMGGLRAQEFRVQPNTMGTQEVLANGREFQLCLRADRRLVNPELATKTSPTFFLT
ncbi:MAG: hypothetical protein O2954_12150 [bacterium]|nr:hypothetical protein [bacterium]